VAAYVLGATLLAAIAVATAHETYKLALRVIDGRSDPAAQHRAAHARRELTGASIS
jgi:hypothetical protein